MSDTDDEAAFASADEGDQREKGGKAETKDGAAAAVPSEPMKKESGRNQKKKGKKGGKKNANNDSQKDPAKPESGSKKTTDVKPGQKTGKEGSKTETKQTGKEASKPETEKSGKEASKTETAKTGKTQSGKTETENTKSSVEEVKGDKPETKAVEESKSSGGDIGDGKASSKPAAAEGETTEGKLVGESVGQEVRTSGTPEKAPAQPAQVASPNPQSITRAQADAGTKEDISEVQEEKPEKKESGSWGWGVWGSSLLTAASSSVSTFTSQVGEGFNTIVESVESSLGAPPPEEIARLEEEGKAKEQAGEEDEDTDEKGAPQSGDGAVKSSGGDGSTPPVVVAEPIPLVDGVVGDGQAGLDSGQPKEEEKGGGWFSGFGVASLTSTIQNTGKSLVSGSLDAVEALASGGIDVLENIGKKTINVLSDRDPGFKKTKQVMFDGSKKQNLSSMLREAKERAEQDAMHQEEQEEARKHNYGALFEDFQGMAHLEALEILSNQSEKKVQALLSSLPDDTIQQLKPQLIDIKNIFELDDSDYEERQEHEFFKLITDHLSELHLGTTPDKLNKVQEKIRKWIINFYADPPEGEEKEKTEPKEIFHTAIEALAELTAKSVEQFHKAGELILLQQDTDTPYQKRSKSLASLTQVLCTEISILSTKFTQCLHKVSEDLEDTSVVTPLVTNVYLEASNSSTYIQDGFQLLLPVLQQAAIQNSQLVKS
ncbi:protein FAM114A2-like isoform X1 [Haliotis rufescens]|uniref:protein FAM114A2-like isoform X1 n=1 Tax=Haliotis rufescens TaxID=6454 RepID=UPI00201F0FAA|nr:protein FAM114A2-like isoform X1 [Haliotis rufescens]